MKNKVGAETKHLTQSEYLIHLPCPLELQPHLVNLQQHERGLHKEYKSQQRTTWGIH